MCFFVSAILDALTIFVFHQKPFENQKLLYE